MTKQARSDFDVLVVVVVVFVVAIAISSVCGGADESTFSLWKQTM